jgi:ribonucleoside-triphosphate reductase
MPSSQNDLCGNSEPAKDDIMATQNKIDLSSQLLSNVTAFRSYAKYLPHLARRESLEESVNRYMHMQLDRFPKLSADIVKAFQIVHELKAMGSMRALQFAGDAVLKNNCRLYNCSYRSIDDVRAFGEALFLLLSGTGFGYSVQRRHVSLLPSVQKPREEGMFVVQDSIIGWAQALDALMESYFFGRSRPVYDFSKIRPKGSYLSTTGAKAPGPEPLRRTLKQVEDRLKLAIGRKLSPLEVHDIVCITSECVLAGGIRRSACICLFDRNDKEMLTCKSGEWWKDAPWRARANNSAILPRSEVTKEEFMSIYEACQKSGAGEPGFSWTNDADNYGTNPCAEISLKSQGFCNLSTVNVTGVWSEKEFMRRIWAATLLGTLQASYTDFPYLTPNWKKNAEEEALLGVSMTGVADNISFLTAEVLDKGAKYALEVNEKYAKKIGINPARRVTTVKPEGTSSCVLMSSSGIHDRHSPYYLRRIRMGKDDSLTKYLKSVMPEFVEDDLSSSGVVVTFPQASPEGALCREQSTAEGLFARAMLFNKHWVAPGHREGPNKHNVSCTVSLRDDEWAGLGEKLWKSREHYSGISLLPFDGGNYSQMPFEECTKETYEEMLLKVKNIDLRNVLEMEDNTELTETVACAGGQCEWTPGQK